MRDEAQRYCWGQPTSQRRERPVKLEDVLLALRHQVAHLLQIYRFAWGGNLGPGLLEEPGDPEGQAPGVGGRQRGKPEKAALPKTRGQGEGMDRPQGT